MTKVTYKKLRKVWGYALIGEDKIELYHKLKGKKHLEILIHEKLHLLYPDLDEGAIKRDARKMASTLWAEGYRKL